MKKLLAAGLLALTMSPLTAMADITVNIPKGVTLDSLTYDYTTIQNLATAKSRAERGTVVTKAPLNTQAYMHSPVRTSSSTSPLLTLSTINCQAHLSSTRSMR